MHVFDSQVSTAVITKGRSSSRLLNFTLRECAALFLAKDLYPLVAWPSPSGIFPTWGVGSFSNGEAEDRHGGPETAIARESGKGKRSQGAFEEGWDEGEHVQGVQGCRLRLFVCLTSWGIRTSGNVEKLGLELSEFINHFWQDDLPEQHAMDALPAFLPGFRGCCARA